MNVTMSIPQKQRARDPESGYGREVVEKIGRTLPDLMRLHDAWDGGRILALRLEIEND
jgi:hypothetical protein